MCQLLGRDADEHGVLVCQLPATEVRLQRRSRLSGYCVVTWRHGHVAEPTELSADDAARYWADVMVVSRTVEREYEPMKMNLFTLGNWVPHLHTHVVPRYRDDPAPGQPIPWHEIFDDGASDDSLPGRAAQLATRLTAG
jgi:diadenosine tetraphosphate (Ap4A) HIT family hydrolase